MKNTLTSVTGQSKNEVLPLLNDSFFQKEYNIILIGSIKFKKFLQIFYFDLRRH